MPVKMESVISDDDPFDFVRFRILPENRYEACLCSNENEEIVGHGPLDQLVEHLPIIKNQIAKETLDKFKLESPNTIDHPRFTIGTLKRLVQIVGSSSLKKAIAIDNEMCQLEEARTFHPSLYTQADDITSSDTSKNELVRAMDSRLAALTEDLVSTFKLSDKGAVSVQEMMDLQKCCQHFGDIKFRNLISRLSERNQKSDVHSPLDESESPSPFGSENDYVSRSGGNNQVSTTVKAVKYNLNQANVSEIDRQISTERDESSFSSLDDDQPLAESSRILIRSISPRRSSSPMRKIQIGRSGSRRTPALAIRSLPYFLTRERSFSLNDTGNVSDPEAGEENNKKTEANVTRTSVQDAISLFEWKQRDDTVDCPKKSIDDSSVNSNKAVLIMDNDRVSKRNVKFESNLNVKDGQEKQKGEIGKKLDSVEWSRKKEAELNEMLMNFTQYNLGNNNNTEPGKSKNHQGYRKAGRDEKVYGETTEKKVEKQADLRAKKKLIDQPKTEKSSTKVSDVGRKHTTSKTVNINKNAPMSSKTKKESPKPDLLKRAPLKTSPLPATKKSWSSTPSPRPLGTVSDQKLQPPMSVLRSGNESEKSRPQKKDVKRAQVDTKKKSMKSDDLKERSASKNGKTTLTKTAVGPKDDSAVGPVKAVVRKKGTKKSSVVPLEAKKTEISVQAQQTSRNSEDVVTINSEIIHADARNMEISVQAEKSLRIVENVVTITSEVIHALDVVKESDTEIEVLELGRELEREQSKNGNKQTISVEASVQDSETVDRQLDSPAEFRSAQELVISPVAWEESNEQDLTIPIAYGSSPFRVNDNMVVGSSAIRAGHSLSQIFLKECCKPDIIEWGNAENPPSMIYQKDSPIGLKRLLKFTRRNKKRSNSSSSLARSSSKNQDRHITKGTRSFFSLSAFRRNES